ncbi:DUF4282 domain-containing protein [Actinocorallia longicatena]|uniref:DUF4282 domain-containing protein n=1 Tax=Actinocorallia longicatena TaxID=111803 RepID=A0ABP6QNW2_9ACTN
MKKAASGHYSPEAVRSALADPGFDYFLTPHLVKLLYRGYQLLSGCVSLAFLYLLWAFSWLLGNVLLWIAIALTPCAWIGSVLVVRVILESLLTGFSINYHLADLRKIADETRRSSRPWLN